MRYFVLPSIALLALIPLVASANVDVIIVGDSITHGKESMPVGTKTHGFGYVGYLSSHLRVDAVVVRAGCGGTVAADWTVADGINICPETPNGDPKIYEKMVVPFLPAKVAVFMLGTNDSIGFGWHGGHVYTAQEYDTAIRSLSSRLLSGGVNHVIIMVPPLIYDTGLSDANVMILQYRTKIQALCAENSSITCGPDLTVLGTRSWFDNDDIHPNETGHKAIASALAPFVENRIGP